MFTDKDLLPLKEGLWLLNTVEWVNRELSIITGIGCTSIFTGYWMLLFADKEAFVVDEIDCSGIEYGRLDETYV